MTLLISDIFQLPVLTHVNLTSQASDKMLFALARHCQDLVDLGADALDITDRGIMAICGAELPRRRRASTCGCNSWPT